MADLKVFELLFFLKNFEFLKKLTDIKLVAS